MKGHNLKIDRLRGLFALAIVVGHAYDVAEVKPIGDTLFRILAPARYLLGFQWVVGFVVLSGFCISLSCRRQTRFSFKQFWLMRATRLFPMLFAAIVMAGAFEWMMLGSSARPPIWPENVDVRHFFTNLFGLGGFYGRFGSLAPAYTLSYELLYYFLWSASLAALSAASASAVNAAFVVIFLYFNPEISQALPLFASRILSSFIIVIYIPWLLGAAVANHLDVLTRNRVVVGVARLGWAVLPFFLIYMWDDYRFPSLDPSHTSAIAPAVAYYGVLGVIFSLIIIDCYRPGAGFEAPVLDKRLGLLSYPLFLLHGPVIIFAAFLLNTAGIRMRFMLHFGLLVATATAVSWAVALVLEQRVMAARSRLRERAAAAASIASEQEPLVAVTG